MGDFQARPTIYKGIRMRSRLEAGFAGWLDRMGLSWEYEPYAVGDEHGQYLPDFLVRDVFAFLDDDKVGDAHIEVKPNRGAVDWDKLTRGATQLWEANRGTLFLVTPDTNPLVIWPKGGWAPAVWCHVDAPSSETYSARLTVAAFEPPLQRDWWT